MLYRITMALALLHCCSTMFVHADELQRSIEQGDTETVRSKIQQVSELLEQKLPMGMTPLNLAASLGKTEIVEYLLSIGADITSGDNEGSQAIHNAAAGGHLETLKLLVSKGAALDVRDLNGMTPIGFACQRNKLETVEWLVAEGADIQNGSTNGLTPFFDAVIAGNIEMVDFLLEHGAKWNGAMTDGVTPLHYAAARGRTVLVEKLIKLGIKPDVKTEQGVTPLFWATGPQAFDAAKRLIEAGADVKHTDRVGRTALHFAAHRGSADTIRFLIEHGADVEAKDKDGLTPITIAAGGNIVAARCMILGGASVNPCVCDPASTDCRCGNRSTPLHFAARQADLEMVRLLVENGARVNIRDKAGCTPLYCAVQKNNSEVVSYLLDRGAIAGVPDFDTGRTELHVAAMKGNREISRVLIERGVSLDAKDGQSKTALDLAFFHHFKRLGYDLLAAGSADNDLQEQINVIKPSPEPLPMSHARVWHLGHSAWAVKTKDHLLVFDYAPNPNETAPEEASLFSGYVIPEQLKNENVVVFATHAHADHFSPECFKWGESISRIHFILGFDPQRPQDDYTVAGPGQSKTIDQVEIQTIRSTDQGVGFLVKVDGLTIFHAGDHASGSDETTPAFRTEIDKLREQPIDLAFLAIIGCGIGDQEHIQSGIEYVVKALSPKVVIPMHAGDQFAEYHRFAQFAETKHMQTKLIYPMSRGDRFDYGGTSSDHPRE